MTKPARRRPAATRDDALVDALVQAAFTALAALNRVGAENDLSLTQLRVLGILRDRRPRMAALADYLGLEKSTMSGLIDRAEKRGLVARAVSAQDARAVDVFLTPDGAALAQRLGAQVRAALSPLIGRLGARDRQRTRDLLRRMLDSHQG